jgi:hypothetical protein
VATGAAAEAGGGSGAATAEEPAVDYAVLRDKLDALADAERGGEPDVSMTDSKMRGLIERIKGLEGSNARLRRRVEHVRSDEEAIVQQNQQLMRQLDRLKETLDLQQAQLKKKENVRVSVAGPVENYANRTGEKWPPLKKERRKPFPGVGQELGAAVDATKQILSQIFESVSDACDFFNTSLTETMSRAELRRGITRLRIKNLDPDHVMWDLDRRPEDGLTCSLFLEAFDWKQAHRLHTGVRSTESRTSISSVRESKPRIDAAVSEALAKTPQGWDAIRYMSRFRAVHQVERAKPQYDPATLIDIIDPKDVRLLSAREKFMFRSMQPPVTGKFRTPTKGGEKSWAERLASPGWKKDAAEEDLGAAALKLEHEKNVELARQRLNSTRPKTLKLDLSGLSCPLLPESVTFSSRPGTKKAIKPQHKLTDGFAFSEDGDHVRRLMREHEAIMSGRRPVMTSVTADHIWLKQSALLAAAQRKEEEGAHEKERYDLDGRCYPANCDPASENNTMDMGNNTEMEASLDAAAKSGDRAELSAILKRRQENQNQSASRDPYTHASPANIAYMQVQQLASSSMGALISPAEDPALVKMLDTVCRQYPRGGSVATKIQSRPQPLQPPHVPTPRAFENQTFSGN